MQLALTVLPSAAAAPAETWQQCQGTQQPGGNALCIPLTVPLLAAAAPAEPGQQCASHPQQLPHSWPAALVHAWPPKQPAHHMSGLRNVQRRVEHAVQQRRAGLAMYDITKECVFVR